MKYTHWYLRGWEYEDRVRRDGTPERALVYHGEYYRLASGGRTLTRLKPACAVLTALLWGMLLILLTHISRGASLFFVGGPCGLALIPAIYLAIGCIRVMGAPPVMTYRDLRASFHRIRLSSKWILALMTICLVGELFYLGYRAVNGLAILWSAEGLWVAGGVLCILIPCAVLALLSRYRVELCPPGTMPENP